MRPWAVVERARRTARGLGAEGSRDPVAGPSNKVERLAGAGGGEVSPVGRVSSAAVVYVRDQLICGGPEHRHRPAQAEMAPSPKGQGYAKVSVDDDIDDDVTDPLRDFPDCPSSKKGVSRHSRAPAGQKPPSPTLAHSRSCLLARRQPPPLTAPAPASSFPVAGAQGELVQPAGLWLVRALDQARRPRAAGDERHLAARPGRLGA